MSAYLARLKQFEREKFSAYAPYTVPSKPSKAPFEPFEGTCLAHIEEKLIDEEATRSKKDAPKAHSKQSMVVARSELTRLVRFCAEINGFTEEEHADALECAIADFDSAMIFFKSYEQETLSSAVATTHLKQVGNANPSTIANERNQALAAGPQQTCNDFNPGDKSK